MVKSQGRLSRKLAMPVLCSAAIEPLSTEAFRELDYRVMRHAFDSQNDLGRLADERIYQSDLANRLRDEGIPVLREVELILSYESFYKSLYLDLVVARQGIYELKVVKTLTDAHIGQLLTYLHLLDLPRGKLINFGSPQVESQFVNAPFRKRHRREFRVIDSDYRGSDFFKQLVIGLLRDWGTALTLALYQEAIVALLGGNNKVEVMLPLHRNRACLGNQRFHLATAESAFRFSALSQNADAFENQLLRLIRYSPLTAIHWINIKHEEVVLKTLSKTDC
jgi:GxxExxY protein